MLPRSIVPPTAAATLSGVMSLTSMVAPELHQLPLEDLVRRRNDPIAPDARSAQFV
jgi:hypothetical protein